MRKKRPFMIAVVTAIVMIFSMASFAMTGGIPAVHGGSGSIFGEAVQQFARTQPGDLAEHVRAVNGQAVEGSAQLSEADMTAGLPAEHGLSGAAFGAAVSASAQSEPGAVAAHVIAMQDTDVGTDQTDVDEMSGGMPAAHDLSGADFGAAVSALAQSEPGAVAAHVLAMQDTDVGTDQTDVDEMSGGLPAAHDLSGAEFGAAVGELAQSDPAVLVGHVLDAIENLPEAEDQAGHAPESVPPVETPPSTVPPVGRP